VRTTLCIILSVKKRETQYKSNKIEKVFHYAVGRGQEVPVRTKFLIVELATYIEGIIIMKTATYTATFPSIGHS
jgi:hypothetical protein